MYSCLKAKYMPDARFQAARDQQRRYTLDMLFASHSRKILYAALLARDRASSPNPVRKPKFKHTRFLASIPACLEAGFRPCVAGHSTR